MLVLMKLHIDQPTLWKIMIEKSMTTAGCNVALVGSGFFFKPGAVPRSLFSIQNSFSSNFRFSDRCYATLHLLNDRLALI